MPETTDRILYLIGKHFRNELTKDEQREFEEWLSENKKNRKFLSEFSNDETMEENMRLYLKAEIPDAWSRFQQRKHTSFPVLEETYKFWTRAKKLAAVAVLAIILVAGSMYYKKAGRKNSSETANATSQQQNNPESTIKGELLLADGTTVSLQNLQDGLVNNQGIYQVVKNMDDLYYNQNATSNVTEALYNTVKTLPGGHCRLIFADGTIIEMNVASTLKFGVSSFHLSRKVKVTGEALFDVKHDPVIPFEVTIPPLTKDGRTGIVKVLGTRFNINAYEGERDRKITLLRGKVNVSPLPLKAPETMPATNDIPIYTPLTDIGDQAQMNNDGRVSVVHNIDTAEVIAWKERAVSFNRTTTEKVLSALERWYDVKVDYNNLKAPDYHFTGKINPQTKIETVLTIMQLQCKALHLKYDSITKVIKLIP